MFGELNANAHYEVCQSRQAKAVGLVSPTEHEAFMILHKYANTVIQVRFLLYIKS